jgi:hypothetical protein
MRKIIMAFAALATVGLAVPALTSQANARTVIIKEGHHGWHHHHRWHRHHGWHRGWHHRHHHNGDRIIIRPR